MSHSCASTYLPSGFPPAVHICLCLTLCFVGVQVDWGYHSAKVLFSITSSFLFLFFNNLLLSIFLFVWVFLGRFATLVIHTVSITVRAGESQALSPFRHMSVNTHTLSTHITHSTNPVLTPALGQLASCVKCEPCVSVRQSATHQGCRKALCTPSSDLKTCLRHTTY